MSVSRRRFLAASVAFPFLAGRLPELLEPEPELEQLKLVRYTRRLEITEEALEATQGNREAFEAWAEEEIPRRMDELNQLMHGTFRNDIIESVTDSAPDFLTPPSSRGRYFETSHLFTRPS